MNGMNDPAPGVVELGIRHAALCAMAAEYLEGEWMERQGPKIYGRSDKGQAVIRAGVLTVSEDGDGRIEWCVERADCVTLGHASNVGAVHLISNRPGEEPNP